MTRSAKLILALVGALSGCTGGGTSSAPDLGPDLTLTFPTGCMSGAKDGNETDVDCGGNACPKCMPGQACLHGSDCDSGICDNNVCAPSSCTDQLHNGTETDVDCGGSCPGCAVGKMCMVAGDCQSASCVNNTCRPSPCTNGMKDGMETDVDCGGGTCPACAIGKMCLMAADCQTMRCVNNACVMDMMMAKCNDGVKNGAETDVDCGGGTCPACVVGKTCAINGDCVSGSCSGGKCVTKGMVSFAMPVTYLLGKVDASLEFGDLNNDGAMDVLIVAQDQAAPNNTFIRPLLNDGKGGLKAGTNTKVGAQPNKDIVVADFDRDGKLDALLSYSNINSAVWLGNGDGTFRAGLSNLAPGRWMTTFDANQDGKPDVIMAPATYPNPPITLLGNGDGTFMARQWGYSANAIQDLGIADFNRDGIPDVWLATISNPALKVSFSAFIGKGDGTFGAQPASSVVIGVSPNAGADGRVADFDGDGKVDAIATAGMGGLFMLTGNGDGTFQMPVQSKLLNAAYACTVADFTLDGRPDLIVDDQQNILLLANDGAGGFRQPIQLGPRIWTKHTSVDINGDKKPDIVGIGVDMNNDINVSVILNTSS